MENPVYNFEHVISANNQVVEDFSGDRNARRSRPFKSIRLINQNNSALSLWLDNTKYKITENSDSDETLIDRVFYTYRIVNDTASEVTVQVEVSNKQEKSETLSGKILNLLNRFKL